MGKIVKNKSVYKMEYRLSMKTKGKNTIEEHEIVREIFNRICENHGIKCKKISTQDNIVDVFFTAKPETELLKFINTYKTAVSRKIRSMAIEKNLTSKDGFWEKGYLLVTVGDDSEKIFKDYIR